MELPLDSCTSILVCLSEENKNTNLKQYIHLFIAALLVVAKIWKQPRCPQVDECIQNKCYM